MAAADRRRPQMREYTEARAKAMAALVASGMYIMSRRVSGSRKLV